MKIKDLTEYKSFIEKQLKQTYPGPKTNEFIVMPRYNNMIESIVEEYILNKLIKTARKTCDFDSVTLS
ncbi:MAG: hypothetical protein E7310_08255 [Clostridiales bacterium]|nr:hypothetical protein [Clostridiales bacterium]